MKGIWRKVVSTQTYYNPGYEKHWAVGGGCVLTLECGHTKRIKLSQKRPCKVSCITCMNFRNGSIEWRDGVCEMWDEETKAPIKTKMTREEFEERCREIRERIIPDFSR